MHKVDNTNLARRRWSKIKCLQCIVSPNKYPLCRPGSAQWEVRNESQNNFLSQGKNQYSDCCINQKLKNAYWETILCHSNDNYQLQLKDSVNESYFNMENQKLKKDLLPQIKSVLVLAFRNVLYHFCTSFPLSLGLLQ